MRLNSIPSEIEEYLSDNGSDFMHGDTYDVEENLCGWNMNHVDSHGGEGQGENYWSVYKFEKDGNEVFIQFRGWYASYHGADYEGMCVVEPREKTITVYERI